MRARVRESRGPSRSRAAAVRPRRLAHILVFTRDISGAIRFYGEVLGLRLSDRSGDMLAFMHGVHGSDHHMIAFVKSEAPGLHHSSWDVGSINEIGIGAMQMADKGFAAGWGLGRHVLGSNYFHYVRDPWGSYAEYSSDIDYIPVDHDWQDADHPAEIRSTSGARRRRMTSLSTTRHQQPDVSRARRNAKALRRRPGIVPI